MNDFKIHEIFACPIFFKDLNLNNERLEKYALKLKKETKGNNKSNKGGFQSDNLPFLKEKVLQPLYNNIMECLHHYKNYLGFKQGLQNKILNMWINVNSAKDYHTSHIHPNSIFSGVYYINAPVNSGNIWFENPSLDKMQYDWLDFYKEKFNEVNSENFFMSSLTGRLLLFPSWLKHSVSANLSKSHRIALSFNTHFVL